jgi:adenine C2-methylase RlmN of 23S rRNA A2503 and tRNA A37
LNLIDTSPINVSLWISGQKVDEFLVDQYWVNLYNDKKTSFEKIGNIPTRTTSNRVKNALTGYIINPGVLTVEENIPTNVSFPPIQS